MRPRSESGSALNMLPPRKSAGGTVRQVSLDITTRRRRKRVSRATLRSCRNVGPRVQPVGQPLFAGWRPAGFSAPESHRQTKLLRSRPRVDRPIREPANSAEWYAGVPNSADAPIFALSNCSAARLADLPRERAFEVVC